MSKMQISSSPINIPKGPNSGTYFIRKPVLNTSEHKTLECIQDWYKEERYDKIIKKKYSIQKIEESLEQGDNSKKMILLQILEYQIAASFQSDKDHLNEAQKFILIPHSLLAANIKDISLFYKSILNILDVYNSVPHYDDLDIAYTPARSLYINSIEQYIERLKEISTLEDNSKHLVGVASEVVGV